MATAKVFKTPLKTPLAMGRVLLSSYGALPEFLV
jgi:hypothetical protein